MPEPDGDTRNVSRVSQELTISRKGGGAKPCRFDRRSSAPSDHEEVDHHGWGGVHRLPRGGEAARGRPSRRPGGQPQPPRRRGLNLPWPPRPRRHRLRLGRHPRCPRMPRAGAARRRRRRAAFGRPGWPSPPGSPTSAPTSLSMPRHPERPGAVRTAAQPAEWRCPSAGIDWVRDNAHLVDANPLVGTQAAVHALRSSPPRRSPLARARRVQPPGAARDRLEPGPSVSLLRVS